MSEANTPGVIHRVEVLEGRANKLETAVETLKTSVGAMKEDLVEVKAAQGKLSDKIDAQTGELGDKMDEVKDVAARTWPVAAVVTVTVLTSLLAACVTAFGFLIH